MWYALYVRHYKEYSMNTPVKPRERVIRITMGDRHAECHFYGVPQDLEWHLEKITRQVVAETFLSATSVARDLAIWKKAVAIACNEETMANILSQVDKESQ